MYFYNTMIYKIYALIDPLTDEIRYIGYTSKSLEKRLKSHIYDCNRTKSHKTNWIRSLLNKGLKPIIKQLNETNEIKVCLDMEVYYISLYDNLTNSTSGGETSKTYRKDVLIKMSENRKGKHKGADHWNYGKKMPELSERNRNYVWTEEIKDKIRQKQLKNNECPIFRLNHTLAQKTRIRLEVFKDGISVGIYESKKQACRELKLDIKSINLVLKGKHKQHKGYTFREIFN